MKVLDVPAPPSSKRSRAPIDDEWGPDGELDLLAPVLFAWRYRYFVIAAALVGALLGLGAAFVQPLRYTAAAVVFLTARTPNPLAPDPITVEALERLAMSNVVRPRAEADLRKRNLITAGAQLVDFRPQLHKSVEANRPYLPMLGLEVDATTPELARDAANAWAETLTVEAAKLIAANRASTVEFIVNEYPKESQRLRKEEQSLEAFKSEQERSLGAVKNHAAVSLREAQLWSREQLVVELEEQQHRVLIDLKEAEASVTAIEQELKQVPQFLVVSKGAVADQQVNPVYTQLTQKLADARVKRSQLSSRIPALQTQIAGARKEAVDLRAALESSARAVDNLERQQKTEFDAKEREVAAVRESFKKLEERIGDATLLANDRETTVNVGSAAEAPSGPSGPSRARYAAVGGLLGLAIALLGTWVADRIRREPALA
jgi:hypothetical protein